VERTSLRWEKRTEGNQLVEAVFAEISFSLGGNVYLLLMSVQDNSGLDCSVHSSVDLVVHRVGQTWKGLRAEAH
jgi:hypothetical protein